MTGDERDHLLDLIGTRVLVGDGCWEWVGAIGAHGYGTLTARGGGPILAHRLMFELLVGPIPDGLHIDHLCRVRSCVRPDHLEPVTPAENNRRAGAVKSHCPRGHSYDATNTYFRPSGARVCRVCRRTRWVKS